MMFIKVPNLARAVATAVMFSALVLPDCAMAESLPEPVAIPIKIVESIKEGPAWLEEELRAKNLHSGWQITDGKLMTSDLDVIKYVNRVRAFLELDPGNEFPYFVLPLIDGKGARGVCVTLYPRDLLPKLAALDFRKEEFSVPDLNAPEVAKCLVQEKTSQPFDSMSRAEFRSHYFGKFGELNMDSFKELNGNPSFIRRAYELGFYPFEGSLTGYLQIN